MSLRLSTVILPHRRWHEGGRASWRRAEELGFHTAYTYDHLSWRSFRDGPWFGAMPTLTAAAGVTERMRLGTLVTSPNFRHPVTLAKELISLDDISGGRVTLGIGAGGTGFDATVLGQEPWTPRERADRFAEFVPLADRLLTEESVSYEGDFYSAHGARSIPGCVRRPRLPFAGRSRGWPTRVPRSAVTRPVSTRSSSPVSPRTVAVRWSRWRRSWTSRAATQSWASPTS